MPMDARQAQLEQAAKAQGFPSYQAWADWDRQRSMVHGGTVGGPGVVGSVINHMPAPVQRVAAQAGSAFDWHPARILQRISDMFGAINAQNSGE